MGDFIFLNESGLKPLPGRKVIKARDYLAYLEAEDVFDKARDEAAKIIDKAEQIYHSEKKKGYADGLDQGKQEIITKITEHAIKTSEYYESIEKQTINIVTRAMEKILGEIGDDEVIIRVVRNILTLARNQKQVTLRVSPSQLELVESKLHEIMSDFPVISFISVESDSRLKTGGCILESDFGMVDASIGFQIEAIRNALKKSLKPSVLEKMYEKLGDAL